MVMFVLVIIGDDLITDGDDGGLAAVEPRFHTDPVGAPPRRLVLVVEPVPAQLQHRLAVPGHSVRSY